MKQSVVAGLTAIVVALSLSSCSSDSNNESSTTNNPRANPTVAGMPSPVASDRLADISWQGECGSDQMALDFKKPFTVGEVGSRIIQEGTGQEIMPGHKVTLAVVGYDAATGDIGFSTAISGKMETILLASAADDSSDDPIVQAIAGQSTDDAFFEVLGGHKVGTCLIMAIPKAQESQDGQGSMPELLLALRVADTTAILAKAQGEIIPQTDPNLPLVTLDNTGRPFIEVPNGVAPPTKLVVKDLIKGDGTAAQLGQELTVHFASWKWAGGGEFDSSWGRLKPETFQLDKSQVIEGWTTGLVGKTVGSQVLLVVPPEMSKDQDSQDTTPADSTLVFVIDILDAA